MALRIMFERGREIGPIMRRFLMNTLFDSTFMQLGIIIGSAFAGNPELRLVLGTLLTSSIALGISTGVSVYESETLERERRIIELEKALFRKLDETMIMDKYRDYARTLAIVNFLTPLLCCGIVVVPLLLGSTQHLDAMTASWISVALALTILFASGAYFGRSGKQHAFLKGLRMVAFGVVAFVVGFLIQTLI